MRQFKRTTEHLAPMPEYDIFKRKLYQNNVDYDFVSEFRPAATLDSKAFIEFNIKPGDDEYLRLYKSEFYLRLKIHIEKPLTKTDPTTDDWKNVSTCNNLLNSLFKHVEFWIGDRLIDPPHHTYAYKTYLEKLLGKSREVKESSASLGFWVEQTMENPDSLISDFSDLLKPETGENMKESKEIELLGKIHLPMFEQRSTDLIGGLKLKLRFHPNDPAFYIKCTNDVRVKSVEFTDCSLRVKGCKMTKLVTDGHESGLLTRNASFFLMESFVVPTTINSGTQDIIIDNLHNGQVPNRAFIMFVDHRAFNGSHTLNPYNFQNFKVNHLALYVNGSPVGGLPKNPNFTKGWYAREYYDLFEVTNQDNMDTCITIKKSEFVKGNNIFAFRVLPDLVSGGARDLGFVNPLKMGSLRLHLRFEEPLQQTITVLVYLDFDSDLEINSERNVIYEFK